MESNLLKLKHDVNSDIKSIFECCELLLHSPDSAEDVTLGLNLILDKKEGLSQNIDQLFSILS
jgi:hypothetical protein